VICGNATRRLMARTPDQLSMQCVETWLGIAAAFQLGVSFRWLLGLAHGVNLDQAVELMVERRVGTLCEVEGIRFDLTRNVPLYYPILDRTKSRPQTKRGALVNGTTCICKSGPTCSTADSVWARTHVISHTGRLGWPRPDEHVTKQATPKTGCTRRFPN
jgi:hypothetical protein